MRKKRIVTFFLIASLFAIATSAQETKSITTEIQGIVPLIFSLNSDMTDVETVDLVNDDSAYLGKVVVYTNSKGIWTITVRSSNLGKLVGRTAGNTDVYPYRFEFGSVDDIDLANPFKVTYSTLRDKTAVEYPINIRYTKLEDMDDPVRSDTYSDIVTITVTVS